MGGGGPDPTVLVQLFQRPDLIGVFVIFIVALIRGWLVLGREYDKLEKERDMWMDMALRSTGLATRVTSVAEQRFGQGGYGPQGGMPPQGYGQAPGNAPQYGPRPPQMPPTTPPTGYPPTSEQPQ